MFDSLVQYLMEEVAMDGDEGGSRFSLSRWDSSGMG
jgi:hypothetical protein